MSAGKTSSHPVPPMGKPKWKFGFRLVRVTIWKKHFSTHFKGAAYNGSRTRTKIKSRKVDTYPRGEHAILEMGCRRITGHFHHRPRLQPVEGRAEVHYQRHHHANCLFRGNGHWSSHRTEGTKKSKEGGRMTKLKDRINPGCTLAIAWIAITFVFILSNNTAEQNGGWGMLGIAAGWRFGFHIPDI